MFIRSSNTELEKIQAARRRHQGIDSNVRPEIRAVIDAVRAGHPIPDVSPRGANPYQQQAHAIGLGHGIPGVGNLEEALTPPGWKDGDPPVDLARARALYDTARADAKKALRETISKTVHESAEDQEAFRIEKDQQWEAQRRLDEFVYDQRVKLYSDYRQGQIVQSNNSIATATVQQPGPQNVAVSSNVATYPYSPTPSNGLTPSFMGFNGSPFNAQHAHSPTATPVFNGYTQGTYTSSASIPSPSLLDPSLIPGTLESVVRAYNDRRAFLMQQINANDQMLASWLQKYVAYLPNGFMTNTMSPFGGSNGVNSQGTAWQAGQSSAQLVSYQNPGQTQGYYGTASGATAQSPIRTSSYPDPRNYGAMPNGQSDGAATAPNMGPPKHEADKERVWYHDQLAEANLPTSTISSAALRAGMVIGPKTAKLPAPPPPKKRRARAKEEIDPSKGFVIPKKAANDLAANGVPGARKTRGRSSSSSTTIAADPANTASVGVGSGALAAHDVGTSRFGGAQCSFNTASTDEEVLSGEGSEMDEDSEDVATRSQQPKRKASNKRVRR